METFILLKQELSLIAIIFIILFLKLGKDKSNQSYINIVNVMLLINLIMLRPMVADGMRHSGGSKACECQSAYGRDKVIFHDKSTLS